jgi:hypothetical protein
MIQKKITNSFAKLRSLLAFFICFYLTVNKSLAQEAAVNYMPYYELASEARLLMYNKEYQKSLSKYEEAFSKFYGFEDDYTDAVKASLKLDNSKKTFALLKEKLLKTGWFNDEIFDSTFQTFLKRSEGKKYLEEKKKWEEENRKTIDPSVFGFIRAVDATDQYARAGFNKLLRTYMTDSVFKLFKPELIEYTDSVNFTRLKKHISTFGFPGRKKLGGKDYMHTIILHLYNYNEKTDSLSAFKRAKFQYLDSVLLQQINLGEFSPWHYAYVTDYSLSVVKTSLYGVNQFFKFPIIDIENVEKRRKAIGLMSLKQQCTLSGKPLPKEYKE